MKPDLLPEQWRTRAQELEVFAPAAAEAFRRAASELEGALIEQAVELLTLQEAALATGYSTSAIGAMIRRGQVPNFGKKGSPRVRRGDLPFRMGALPLGRAPGQVPGTTPRQRALAVAHR